MNHPTHSLDALPVIVKLVGAGPGDPELLTLKALKAIEWATVMLIDDLVSKEIYQLAQPSCRLIFVGKRGGCRSTAQAFIEKLMIQNALSGERVVRLKGGDPGIFGRAGEEIEHLQSVGIEVEIINGISAGLAGASSLGVALTHRQHAHGVMFLTGHPQANEPAMDWVEIAKSASTLKLTLIIYMGMSKVQSIQAGLLSALPLNTPVAVIEQVSTRKQRQVLGELQHLHDLILQHQLASPSVIVVGDILQGVKHIHCVPENSKQTQNINSPPQANCA